MKLLSLSIVINCALQLQNVVGYNTAKCDDRRSNGGACRKPPEDRWTFEKIHRKCVEIDFFGCPGTKNIFNSKSECENTCL
ncbi:papilin [Drosophila santomea]|uniref:papilin n=1 Tax=Drosophila santomea TaxID=129105 RepID=UPI0019537E1C|nr:papilin [Drosophila santomea]